MDIREILHQILNEETSSAQTLHMTANENVLSRSAERLLASSLSHRYHIGTYDDEDSSDLLVDSHRTALGGLVLRNMPAIYQLEKAAREATNRMFHASFADFRPLSGMHAVTCILSHLTDPGDHVLVLSPASVGHHATLPLLERLGRRSSCIPWSFSQFDVDLPALREQIALDPPDAVLLDYGTPLYPLPVSEIREIIGANTPFIYDASHVLGLIAGGAFQDPLKEGCDVLIGNTHKTFPGPQKGVLLYKDETLGRRTADAIFHSLLSTQHTHHALALYLTLLEMDTQGAAYAHQILKNSEALSLSLKREGFDLVERTDQCSQSHMVTLSGPFPRNHHHACALLHRSGISTNSRAMFGIDSLRIGVQELTRRGMRESEMDRIASFYRRILLCRELPEKVAAEVIAFNQQYQSIAFSLDDQLCLQRLQDELFYHCQQAE